MTVGADDRPRAWDYNPSRWSQRWPIIGIALGGFVIATYLGLYQLRWIPSAWDPFFGRGTQRVLDSAVSEAFPVPDALLGAFGYLMDAVAGIIGGTKRWRTMPWMVVVFGILVGPLGLVSIGLVMAQPLVVGDWCTLCLATAVASVVMIGPATDEVLASLQYLKRTHQGSGWRGTWRRFWGLAPKERA